VISLAYKMLVGNKAACLGVIFGIFLATLLIAQQSAIFLGLIDRSYRMVTDIPQPTIWVMDPATENEDKLRSLPKGYLNIVRGVPEVEWAVPLNVTILPVVTPSGKFDMSLLYGIDDATLIGAPINMIEGSIMDLRHPEGVIVDKYSARETLAHVNADGSKSPLKVGNELEINGKRALVVGICDVTRGFLPQPIIFTSLPQFNTFTAGFADRIGYILVKTIDGADISDVTRRINGYAELHALTSDEVKNRIRDYFLKTGILINFGLSVLLGLIIGFSIAGQIFYMMTLGNITNYALIRAVGGTKMMILKMIVFQAFLVGLIGYVLGIGVTIMWGYAIQGTTLAFLFPWQLLVFTGFIVVTICVFTAILSIQKVLRVDPKILMGT